MVKTIALALMVSVFAFGAVSQPATAQNMSACEAKAVSKKDGKPLTGAAKNSSVQKCMKDTCGDQAIDKNGKKLAGAAKESFMKKCQGG